MATNTIQDSATTVQIIAGGTYVSGTPVRIGTLFGVPQAAAVSGEEVALQIRGEVQLVKTGGVAAFALGDKVYWDGSVCTAVATDHWIGVASRAATQAATALYVELNGAVIAAVDADAIAGAASGTYAGDFTRVTSTTIAVKKHNMAATAAPAVTDDSASDYAVGSRWIDTTNDRAYICVDASVGAAVWLPAGLPIKVGTVNVSSGASTGTASVGAALNGFPVVVTLTTHSGAIAAADAYFKAAIAGGTLTVTVLDLAGNPQNASSNLAFFYHIVGTI